MKHILVIRQKIVFFSTTPIENQTFLPHLRVENINFTPQVSLQEVKIFFFPRSQSVTSL